jgi:Terminase RNaseH-like domain
MPKTLDFSDFVPQTNPQVIAGLALAAPENTAQSINPQDNIYKIPNNSTDFLRSCRIRTGAGYQPFDPYLYQILFLEIMRDHIGTILLKDRQLGITEVCAGETLYQSLLDPSFSAAFISTDLKKTGDIQRRTKNMVRVPDLVWERNNGSAIQALGCGSIDFLCSTPRAARGIPAINRLILDEAAFIDKFDEVYGTATGGQESVPIERRRTVLVSTCPEDGMANPVWRIFAENNDRSAIEAMRQARAGGTNCGIPGMVWWVDKEGWAKVIIGHKAHPVYGKDPDYIANVMIRKRIPRAIAEREYNLGIETAGSSLFHSDSIDKYAIGKWQSPIPGRKYFAMTDPNFGGSDNFITLILDITDDAQYQLVNEYAESNRSTEYSEGKTIALIDWYGCKSIAIESNSGGKIVLESIQRKRPQLEVLLTLTSHVSKRTNTDRIALAIEQGQLIFPPDWKGLSEMRSFSVSKREAVAGEKDDRVMALAAGFAHIDEARGRQEVYSPGFGGDPIG